MGRYLGDPASHSCRVQNGCETSLSDACDSSHDCPKGKEDAIVAICESRLGSGRWEEGRNGCGGWTVETAGGATAYVSFDFDAAGKLVAVTHWNDMADQCDMVYGTPCKQAGGAVTTLECPASPDAGPRD